MLTCIWHWYCSCWASIWSWYCFSTSRKRCNHRPCVTEWSKYFRRHLTSNHGRILTCSEKSWSKRENMTNTKEISDWHSHKYHYCVNLSTVNLHLVTNSLIHSFTVLRRCLNHLLCKMMSMLPTLRSLWKQLKVNCFSLKLEISITSCNYSLKENQSYTIICKVNKIFDT